MGWFDLSTTLSSSGAAPAQSQASGVPTRPTAVSFKLTEDPSSMMAGFDRGAVMVVEPIIHKLPCLACARVSRVRGEDFFSRQPTAHTWHPDAPCTTRNQVSEAARQVDLAAPQTLPYCVVLRERSRVPGAQLRLGKGADLKLMGPMSAGCAPSTREAHLPCLSARKKKIQIQMDPRQARTCHEHLAARPAVQRPECGWGSRCSRQLVLRP